jgi:phosphatidylglycerol:prolipoprotein diacylglycerol transferase
MIPELFKIGPLTVYSYGLMLGIAFIVASYILTEEFKRKGLEKNFATEITLLAIIFGIVGSKIFSVFETWDEFLADPLGIIFNPGGLTFYGGLIFAVISVWVYVRKKKIPFLYIADAAAPSLVIAYGIGRIGCHLSGDGDYGIPTKLPWGTNYSNGIVKPSVMFRGSEIAKSFPNGIVPDNTPLHPTPVYEFIIALFIFYILWQLRKKDWVDGRLFAFYLILSGIERFFIEFIRLNPRLLFGLSEAQLISILLIVVGISGTIYFIKNPNSPKFVPAPLKQTTDKKKNKISQTK